MSEPVSWRELAPGVFVAVVEPAGVTVGLVVGTDAALIVDTGSTPEQGRVLRASVANVTDKPLVAAVVTHAHYDHAFGLAAFRDLNTIGHEGLAGALAAPAAAAAATQLGLSVSDLVAPGRAISLATSVDLGSRRAEIVHVGRGHTDADAVVVVPDADVVFVGDLLESSGPPSFGDDSFPHDWAGTLDSVIGLMTKTTLAVPGHGNPVDREFAFNQRGEIAAVSGEIYRLYEAGVSESEALSQGSWPYPEDVVAEGVLRGYRTLAAAGLAVNRPTLPLV